MQAADLARDYFKDAPNVFVEDKIPINDGWTRDWGPTVRLRRPALSLLTTCQAGTCHCLAVPLPIPLLCRIRDRNADDR